MYINVYSVVEEFVLLSPTWNDVIPHNDDIWLAPAPADGPQVLLCPHHCVVPIEQQLLKTTSTFVFFPPTVISVHLLFPLRYWTVPIYQRKGIIRRLSCPPLSRELSIEAECWCCSNRNGQKVVPVHYIYSSIVSWNMVWYLDIKCECMYVTVAIHIPVTTYFVLKKAQ